VRRNIIVSVESYHLEMAEANESISNEETAWYFKYFKIVYKDSKDKNTGKESQIAYCECFLPKSNTDPTPCKVSYIFLPKNGTGNYIKHLLNKHGIVIPGVKCFNGKVYSLLIKILNQN
jgi:hypothetical protein